MLTNPDYSIEDMLYTGIFRERAKVTKISELAQPGLFFLPLKWLKVCLKTNGIFQFVNTFKI